MPDTRTTSQILAGICYLSDSPEFINSFKDLKQIVVIDDTWIHACNHLSFPPDRSLISVKEPIDITPEEGIDDLAIDDSLLKFLGTYDGYPVGLVPVSRRRRAEVAAIGDLVQKEGYQELQRPFGLIKVYTPQDQGIQKKGDSPQIQLFS